MKGTSQGHASALGEYCSCLRDCPGGTQSGGWEATPWLPHYHLQGPLSQKTLSCCEKHHMLCSQINSDLIPDMPLLLFLLLLLATYFAV